MWKYEGSDLHLEKDEDIRSLYSVFAGSKIIQVHQVYTCFAEVKQRCCHRVRVMDIKFHAVPTEVELQPDEKKLNPKGTSGNPFSPMEIIASTSGIGLGLTAWWAESEAEAEAMSE